MVYQAISRQVPANNGNSLVQIAAVISDRVPFVGLIAAHRRNPHFTPAPGHGGITEQGQHRRPGHFFISRQQQPRIAYRQSGRYGKLVTAKTFDRALPDTYGNPARQEHQLAAVRQRNQVNFFAGPLCSATYTDCAPFRRVKDFAAFVGKQPGQHGASPLGSPCRLNWFIAGAVPSFSSISTASAAVMIISLINGCSS